MPTSRVRPASSSRRASSAPATPSRAARTDGELTRQHILDVAGRVFAERGHAHTTSKEICERAGTNMAAVNYHFGSRDGLYEAVLVEAHRQIVSVEQLKELVQAEGEPLAKLRAVLGRLLGLGIPAEGSATQEAPWGFKVVLREVMSPSAQAPALIQHAVAPKAMLLRTLVAQIAGLPPEHPAVQRCLLFTILPCIVMVLAPRELGQRVLPAIRDLEGTLDELMRYVGAGLAAVGQPYREEAAVSATSQSRKAARAGRASARSGVTR
ncbi:MAG TPA: CerR family C-terminal domain-containing protein [Variovorax sp.]|nr:CerR family C-terminal domain-containing protein [Variovorax sp.]